MKKLAYAAVAAIAVLGFVLFSPAPANAFPAAPLTGVTTPSDAMTVQYHRYRYHRGPVCTTRTVVTRGYHGRRIVKRVRVCR